MREKRARSVLCLPIVKQTKLIGALCLENNLTPRAFTSDRVVVLGMLASQAAISLENARLYADLQRSEAFLADGQRISSTGSWGWTVPTGDIYWSAETYRIFEYDRATRPTLELARQRVHPDDRAVRQQILDRASNDGMDFDAEYRLLMPDGRVKHLHTSAHALQDSSGTLEFVGAVMDMTARKHAEEALRQAQADLAHVSRVTTMGEMAASIAHEVNQPLSGVVVNANASLRWLAAEPPDLGEARDAIRRIMRDGQRASQVIARVRALSQKTATEKEPLDLNAAIQEVLGLAQSEVNRTRVTLRTAFAPDLPRVLGDRVQLQQVVLNLILNGIEAMSGVVDRPRELTISTHREDPDRVRVVVKDSGIGLDPDKATQIFDAFYTTKRSGMGMGLSISRSIVENHGGRLWAVPNDGPGTTFQFTV